MNKGISVFVGLDDYSLENNLKYIELASKYHYDTVFTSAHINEASNAWNDLEKIIEHAKKHNMKVIVDLSKKVYDTFPLVSKMDGVRLDYGFNDEEFVEISKKDTIKVELNASTITEQKLQKLIDLGLKVDNVRASFNYYPKLYTGHDIEDVSKKIQMFHKFGIRVGVFIPSMFGKRPPMYEGLPSIEKHRKQNLSISIEEIKSIDADEILFGDAYASESELALLDNHLIDDIVLDVIINKDCPDGLIDCLQGLKKIRIDYNQYLLRLNVSKIDNMILEPTNTIERKKFDLTIDNYLFKRYQNEVNIVISDIEKDSRVNVIGKVLCSDLIVKKIKEKLSVRINIIGKN